MWPRNDVPAEMVQILPGYSLLAFTAIVWGVSRQKLSGNPLKTLIGPLLLQCRGSLWGFCKFSTATHTEHHKSIINFLNLITYM